MVKGKQRTCGRPTTVGDCCITVINSRPTPGYRFKAVDPEFLGLVQKLANPYENS